MKLKYYMRGLGLGILITTLILSVGNSKQKLSDKEIMQRASELGMVMKEEENAALEQVIKDSALSPTAEPTAALSPTVEPTTAPTPTTAPSSTPAPTKRPEPTKSSEDGDKITFVIKSGMSSGQVAEVLVNAGLINDADEFNQNIVKSGKASIIRVGTYSISENATYDEIITAITSK